MKRSFNGDNVPIYKHPKYALGDFRFQQLSERKKYFTVVQLLRNDKDDKFNLKLKKGIGNNERIYWITVTKDEINKLPEMYERMRETDTTTIILFQFKNELEKPENMKNSIYEAHNITANIYSMEFSQITGEASNNPIINGSEVENEIETYNEGAINIELVYYDPKEKETVEIK